MKATTQTIPAPLETYADQKHRHGQEFNAFPGIFFAFNQKQFDEGMAKLNLAPDDTGKICRIPGGGYLLKSRVADFKAMFERHDAERQALKNERKGLLDALIYELCNYEFCITHDPTDALEALGLSLEDIPKDILKQALRAAIQEGRAQ